MTVYRDNGPFIHDSLYRLMDDDATSVDGWVDNIIANLRNRPGNPYLSETAYTDETLPLTWDGLGEGFSSPSTAAYEGTGISSPGSWDHFNFFQHGFNANSVQPGAGRTIALIGQTISKNIPHGGMAFETNKSPDSLAIQHSLSARYAKAGKGKIVFDGLVD